MTDTVLSPTSPVLDMLKEDNAADIVESTSDNTAAAQSSSNVILISDSSYPSTGTTTTATSTSYKSSTLSMLNNSGHLQPLDNGSGSTYSKTDFTTLVPTAASKDLSAPHLNEPSSASIHPASTTTTAPATLTVVDSHSSITRTSSPPQEVVGMVQTLSKPGTQDGWVDVQEKTFTRWCNYYLSQRDLKLDSLHDGFQDGNLLCNLVEILSGNKLPQRWKPNARTQVQRLDNLSVGFEGLKRDGVKLVNVRVQEVEAGNDKITMALLWSMIVHYQIEKIARMAKEKKARLAVDTEKERIAAAELAAEEGAKKADEYGVQHVEPTVPVVAEAVKEAPVLGAKAELLGWVNSKIACYDVPFVRDFTANFSDGSVIAALVDALLIEQKTLISLLTKAAIEHEPEDVNAEGKKTLPLTGDSLADTQTAILRAENDLRIPPLVDAADLVSHPNEQAVMTYIACFRDREQTLADIGQQGGIELQTETAPEDLPPAVAEPPSQAEVAATMAGIGSAETVVVAPTAEDAVTIAADSTTVPVLEERTQPSVLYVANVPATADQSAVLVSEETTYTQPAAPMLQINPSAAVSEPMARPGTPVHAMDSQEEKVMAPVGAPVAAPVSPLHNANSPVVMDSFAAPTLSRSDEIKEVDVCMTNVDLQYVQARPDGTLHVSAANTNWSVWTVVDSQATDIVYFRDHKGRYITSDDTGRVFMAPKSEQAKWTVLRGKVQHFRNQAGRFLTAADGQVMTETTAGMHAALTLNFPVIEGILRKKGRSGLKRWQARYFAFNGAVMSYWERKEDAGVTTAPKGLWYINNLHHVSIDTKDDTKFYIYFKDGQAVALDAIQSAECLRWVHSLEMTGIKVQA